MLKSDSDLTRLKYFGLPLITNLDDFSAIIHLSKKLLYKYSFHSYRFYKIYKIPKKTAGERTIYQPNKNLKSIQRWILKNILIKLQPSNICKGFIINSGIKQNAKTHIGANALLVIDLEDFFNNIKSYRVYKVFRIIGYNSTISTIFTNICTYKGFLPQGSPCSPQLSNLVTVDLDEHLQSFVGEKGIVYSRYADDLSFSSRNPSRIYYAKKHIETIIRQKGFIINAKKTRIAGFRRSKKVTGLIITEEQAGIGRNKLRTIRSEIYNAISKNIKPLDKLKGKLSFVKSVDLKRFHNLKKYLSMLDIKYHNQASLEMSSFCIKMKES